VELSLPFAAGDSFAGLAEEGLLHPDTGKCFTLEAGDRQADPVSLYRHQSEAVRPILGGHNTIVATGTGSGKSFCFGIPIASEALRLQDQRVRGIKALIVYPMNALANSQYEDFAKRLAGSGLTLALYTGDTPTSPGRALQQYRRVYGRDQPYDSEVISREEIRRKLPDILMTNDVQLELLLTRFEDRTLFPLSHRGVLRFLVLDEIHTYTGKRGADVARLVRRLKQHTGTTGHLRCIGTSATVESGEGEDTPDLVAQFATRLFGEPFGRQQVVGESYALWPEGLSPRARAIAEALSEGPRMVSEIADQIGLSREAIEEALCSSTESAPKLHVFFSQGRAIHACLGWGEPYLNDRGESICPICANGGRPDVLTFPMYFCRACGQEVYSISITDDGRIHPRDIDTLEHEGEAHYLLPLAYDGEATPLPGNWLTPRGKIKSKYQDPAPEVWR